MIILMNVIITASLMDVEPIDQSVLHKAQFCESSKPSCAYRQEIHHEDEVQIRPSRITSMDIYTPFGPKELSFGFFDRIVAPTCNTGSAQKSTFGSE